ncbi:MAG: Type 1 glutamine amidotransferase-like domain-containing protein [Acidimicrobiales bacterium]
MKLYLSSYRIGADRNALADLVETPGRAGIIFNALDGFADRRRIFARESEDLSSLGFEYEELDLRSYFDDLEGLRDRLSRLRFLWVTGGNSFVLARAMTQSRFREALFGPLSDGRLVYGGYSAGSCVTAPDLEGIDLVDDPGTIPDGYLEDVIPETLHLVPWRIVPHWRSDHPESADAEKAATYLRQSGLDFQTLRDGEALIVANGESHIV